MEWDTIVSFATSHWERWGKNAAPFVVLFLLVCALIILAAAAITSAKRRDDRRRAELLDMEGGLDDPQRRAALSAELSPPTALDAWRAGAERLAARIALWSDKGPNGSASILFFDVACVFLLTLFALAWAAGASGRIAALNVLGDGLPASRRWLVLAFLVAASTIYVWWARASALSRVVASLLYAPVIVAVVILGGDADPHAIMIHTIGAFNVLGLGGWSLVSLSVISVINSVINPLHGSIVVAAIAACAIAIRANASLAFSGWRKTRAALRRANGQRSGEPSVAALIAQIGLDLLVPAFCLIGVVGVTAFVFEGVKTYIKWRGVAAADVSADIVAAVFAYPAYAPANWLALGLLAAVVFPTALHLTAGAVGVALAARPDGRALAARLGDVENATTSHKQELAHDVVRYRARRDGLVAALSLPILLALLTLLWLSAGAWLSGLGWIAERAAAFWR